MNTRGCAFHSTIEGMGQCSGRSAAVTSMWRCLFSVCSISESGSAGDGKFALTPSRPLGGHGREPVAVLDRLARYALEERLLQPLGERAALAAADGAAVQLADRGHFRRGAGEEGLVRAVDLVAGDALGDGRDAELLADAHHR